MTGRYFVYEPATGRIIEEHGWEPADDSKTFICAAAAAGAGLNHYVDSGSLVSMPSRPSDYHEFDYAQKAWVVPAAGELRAQTDMRAKRDSLLQSSDWTDTTSAPERLGLEHYSAWQTYRQALRDITKQDGFPLIVVWPDPPSK